MKINPKRTAEKLQKLIAAWETLRPTKSFAGMTLEEFKAKVQPSLDQRASIATLRHQVTEAREKRRQSDEASLVVAQMVVSGVKADVTEGEDGPLYAAMGYVPKSERQSGLTRKGQTTPPVGDAKA